MKYRTRDCDCLPVIVGVGGRRPEKCPCGNRYLTEREYERSTSGVGSLVPAGQPRLQIAPKRRKSLKRGNGFKASPEQQRATKGRACIVCGKDEAEAIIDPAHVTPRRMAPHCTCEKGTVPLCREHHERYDDLNDQFDLLPHLMAHGLYEETVHGFLEHGVSLREVMDVVTGVKWVPREEPERSAA